jgi:hypothetical protein
MDGMDSMSMFTHNCCPMIIFKSVGKFSALEGSVQTWQWVRRYGVYTHQVPDYPDSIVVVLVSADSGSCC